MQPLSASKFIRSIKDTESITWCFFCSINFSLAVSFHSARHRRHPKSSEKSECCDVIRLIMLHIIKRSKIDIYRSQSSEMSNCTAMERVEDCQQPTFFVLVTCCSFEVSVSSLKQVCDMIWKVLRENIMRSIKCTSITSRYWGFQFDFLFFKFLNKLQH